MNGYGGVARAIAFLAVSFSAFISQAQVHVYTQHHDLDRTGWNRKETILTTKNVKTGKFGMLFSRAVDDQIYAQPLVICNVFSQTTAKKNFVIVATVNNSIYAFDADSMNVTQPYWQINLTPAGSRAVKNSDMTGACGGQYRDFSGNMGIVGTPVVDTATMTLYVVARSVNPTTKVYAQYFHAIDLTTGQQRAGSPVKISPQISSTNGDGAVGGVLTFDAQKQNQRSGLLLSGDGIVYVTWASHCDWTPYHGWVVGFDKTSLAQKVVYNTTPEGYNGGIWMSGGAPAMDSDGNIYLAVGNGSIGKNGNFSDLTNRSESALKLQRNSTTLSVTSFFTPMNISALEASDLDFGVTEVMLLPGTDRAMTGCKDGKIYLLNRNAMGGFNASSNNVVQTIDLGNNAHLRSSLSYYKGENKEFVYSWSENALLKAFPYNRTTNQFDLGQTVSSGVQGPTGNNGALLSVSSNGSVDSTAILWASHAANGDANQSVRPGILRAFAATDVTKELWNSGQVVANVPGNYAKFVCPTIANGKVYLATFSNKLVVYGLTTVTAPVQCNQPNVSSGKTAIATSVEFNNGNVAGNATDGNMSTRWASAYSDPQSITVDLGARHDICNITLHWETASGKDFELQTSNDNVNWTPLLKVTNNLDLDNYFDVTGTGRYVKMYGTARTTQYGYSLYEFEVYGKPSANACAEPTALSVTDLYEDTANLHWAGTTGATYQIQYKTVSAASWTTLTSTTNAIGLSGLACATDYLYQVQAVCDASHSSSYSAPAAFSTLPCNSDCPPLPTRWTTQDIGNTAIAGSACYAEGVFDLKGSGDDIWGTEDAFRFSHKTLVGDGEVRIRVVSIDNSNVWNKCGIMFRETLTPGARNAFIALTSGNGVAFQTRAVTDGASVDQKNDNGLFAPQWLRLTKTGTVYAAYRSEDGISWTAMGAPTDLGFGDGIPVYVGLAITSHDNGLLSEAQVDNYRFTGVLDVTLQSFTAELTLQKSVLLQWVTTLENDLRDFVVERSVNNLVYEDLDTIAAANQGKFTHNYSFEDIHPLAVPTYYRLRMTDNADVVSYSAPVTISTITGINPLDKPPVVFANPTQNGVVHIRPGESAIRSIVLLNMSGRQAMKLTEIGSGTIDIPVNAYANGVYIIEIQTTKGTYREKLIIRN